jgi:L-threonylcarbamoyladenylate synthase
MHASTDIKTAALELKGGGAVIFPTDTVYGLGIAIDSSATPDVLYELKGRAQDKPIAWLVGDESDLLRYGSAVSKFSCALAHAFWPGPLTLVVKASDAVPAPFRSFAGTIGLRMPANPCALSLVREVGCPLATTSANISGQRAVYTFEDLDKGLLSAVSASVCDDSPKSGLASTVLDCTGDYPHVLRQGAITIAQIQALM